MSFGDLYLRKKGGEAREEGPVRGRPVVVEKTCSCEQHGAVAHRAHQLRARGLLLEEIEIGALRIVDDLHQSGRLPARHPNRIIRRCRCAASTKDLATWNGNPLLRKRFIPGSDATTSTSKFAQSNISNGPVTSNMSTSS